MILLIALLSGGGSSAEYALYVKDNEIVFNDFGKDGGVEISESLYEDEVYEYMVSDLSYAITVSDDGKSVIYPDRIGYSDDGMNLYVRSLVKDDEPDKHYPFTVRDVASIQVFNVHTTYVLQYVLLGAGAVGLAGAGTAAGIILHRRKKKKSA